MKINRQLLSENGAAKPLYLWRKIFLPGVSIETGPAQRLSIMRKVGTSSQVGLTIEAIRRSLVDIDRIKFPFTIRAIPFVSCKPTTKSGEVMNHRLNSIRALARSQNFRWLLVMSLLMAIGCLPAMSQFTGGTTLVDPTQGAQSLAKYIIDGLLYVAAAAAALCFLWGCFRLFSRPLEGILEVCVGLIVLGLVGHVLQWGTSLTGQTVG